MVWSKDRESHMTQLQQRLRTKQSSDGCTRQHAAVQFPIYAQWPDCSHIQWNRMPHTCYLLQWPIVYYKCLAQIVETIIEFWNKKQKWLKNDNRFFNYWFTSLIQCEIHDCIIFLQMLFLGCIISGCSHHQQYRTSGEASEAHALGLIPKSGLVLMQVKNGKLVKLLPLNVIL